MKKLTQVLGWTLQAACFVVLVYFALIKGPEKVELVQAKRGLFELAVNSHGTIRSKARYTVTAFADGSMRKLTHKVGDEIVKGAVVTEILVGPNYEPIRAAVSGVISHVFQPNGGKIQRKDPIIEISDPEHMEVITELTADDAHQVNTGDKFSVAHWGGPGTLKGVVTSIGKSTQTAEGERIQVIGELREVPTDIFRQLHDAAAVPVNIQVAEYPDALKVPADAVFRNKNNWVVYEVKGSKAYEKNVTILNRNSEEIMIGKGISDGTTVVNHPSRLIKDGVRVEMN